MPTYIIYSDPNDGYIMSRDANYAPARMGTGTEKTPVTANNIIRIGQNYGSGLYHIYQGFFSFDTSVIPDTEEIVDANISQYCGWVASNHSAQWGQMFFVKNWTAPLTGAQWQNPTAPGTYVANFDYLTANTPWMRRNSGGDALIAAISKTAPTKLVSMGNQTVGGWSTLPTEIYVEGGETTNKPYLVVYTTVLDALNVIEYATATLKDGTTVSIRSNGAATPTLSVGYQPVNGAFTSIGNLDSAFNKTIDSVNSITLTVDPLDNFYVFGPGSSPSTVVGKAFVRTSATSWSGKTALSQNIPAATGASIRSLTAFYTGGTGPNDREAINALVTRGAAGPNPSVPTHVFGAGWTQDMSFNIANLRAGSGALLIGAVQGYWGAPYAATGVPVFVDSARLTDNLHAIYIQRGKFGNQTVGGLSVFKVLNAAGVGVNWNNTYIPTGSSTLLSVDSQSFAHVYDSDGRNLVVAFYNDKAVLMGSASIPSENFQGGVIGRQWAAHYDKESKVVRVHYINTTAGTRALNRVDVSAVTYAATTATNVTTTLGAAGSTNVALRVSKNPDERRVAIDAANNAAGVLSVQTYYSTAGNYVPTAPVVVTRSNFDATLPADFSWTFSDRNPQDVQTKYQVEISNASTLAIVKDTGAVVSTANTYTLPANTLANGTGYRWRVRLYDGVDAAGTWSSYQNFTASATGSVAITSPATDNLAGIDTSSYTVQWSYTGSQAQRQVRVVQVSGAVVLLDSGMEPTSSGSYVISGLLSDVEYSIEVTVINTDGITVPTATRRITTSYAEPMAPSAEITVQDTYIDILTINQPPVGSRPEVVYNDIYKRANKPLSLESDFVRIGTTNNNGSYRDYAVQSGKTYDYKIVGRSS